MGERLASLSLETAGGRPEAGRCRLRSQAFQTRGEQLGYRWGELGWTLETNAAVNAMIKAMACTPYKVYRIFEKALQ